MQTEACAAYGSEEMLTHYEPVTLSSTFRPKNSYKTNKFK